MHIDDARTGVYKLLELVSGQPRLRRFRLSGFERVYRTRCLHWSQIRTGKTGS